jgi:hypothetical protein
MLGTNVEMVVASFYLGWSAHYDAGSPQDRHHLFPLNSVVLLIEHPAARVQSASTVGQGHSGYDRPEGDFRIEAFFVACLKTSLV